MKKHRILATATLAIFPAVVLQAQDNLIIHDRCQEADSTELLISAKGLSLKECMETALTNSEKLKIQSADIDDARVARRDAILQAFTPSISADTYAYSNFGRSVDPQTNTYVSTTSFNNGYGVSGRINIFNGFEAVNNIKISKTALKMGLDREQQMKDEICLATMEAFCNVVYYKQLAQIIDGQVTTLQNALRLARKQEELGQKGYADVIQTEADLADMQYELVTAQNNYNDAVTTLKDIMFWEPGKELAIDEESIINTGLLVPETIPDEITSDAVENNPSVLVARGKILNAKLDLRTAKWKFSPYITLNGGWSTSFFTYPGQTGYTPVPFGQQFRNNSGEYIQITLSFPIFNRLATFSNLRKKQNALKKATAEYNTTVREVQSEIERAIQDRNGATAAFSQAEHRTIVQEKAWEMNRKKFEQGLISPIDFRKAADNRLNAQAEQLNAMLKLQLKNSVVKYYNGISYIDQF